MHNNDDLLDARAAADADLILRTRSGDAAAFAELWRRHYPSGITVARAVSTVIAPDDLVRESYTRIFHAVIRGGGPNGSFRAYLYTSIRNTAAGWGRAQREHAMDDLASHAEVDGTGRDAVDARDRALTAQAFRSLPPEWQEVLWYVDVEQLPPATVAPLLALTPEAVARRADDARAGLREARMGAGATGEPPTSLTCVLLPLLLGASGATAYTAADHDDAALGEAPAMPVAVIGAAGEAGIGTNGNLSAPGGRVSGIGALVGVGSAALIVAGVMVAATIAPGLLSTSPMMAMSSANASEGDDAIATEILADEAIEPADKPVLDLADDTNNPKDRRSIQPAPDGRSPLVRIPPLGAFPVAPPADKPADTGSSGGDVTRPVLPVTPEQPSEGKPPGDGDDGATDPDDGATNPDDDGPAEPGDGDLGTEAGGEPAPGGDAEEPGDGGLGTEVGGEPAPGGDAEDPSPGGDAEEPSLGNGATLTPGDVVVAPVPEDDKSPASGRSEEPGAPTESDTPALSAGAALTEPLPGELLDTASTLE